jgi:hypothetical protein
LHFWTTFLLGWNVLVVVVILLFACVEQSPYGYDTSLTCNINTWLFVLSCNIAVS